MHMNKIKYIFGIFLKVAQVPVYYLTVAIPMKKNLWLFSSWFGEKYADNPRALFEKVASAGQIDARWYTKDHSLFTQLKSEGIPVVYAYSFGGVVASLRAEVVLYTHSITADFVPGFVNRKAKCIQCWHGFPLKAIGLLNTLQKRTKFRKFISNVLFGFSNRGEDLVFACGPLDKEVMQKSFQLDSPNNVVITGYPRNDSLVLSPSKNMSKPRRILYMPTFRGGMGESTTFLHGLIAAFEHIDRTLASEQSRLFIRFHPVQKIPESVKNLVGHSDCVEIIQGHWDFYHEYGYYDALVTDYSSVSFDALLLDKPIYLLPIDYEDYIKSSRDLIYNYGEMVPSVPQYDWISLINYMFNNEYPREKHRKLRDKVHAFNDSNSSERSLQAVFKLLSDGHA